MSDYYNDYIVVKTTASSDGVITAESDVQMIPFHEKTLEIMKKLESISFLTIFNEKMRIKSRDTMQNWLHAYNEDLIFTKQPFINLWARYFDNERFELDTGMDPAVMRLRVLDDFVDTSLPCLVPVEKPIVKPTNTASVSDIMVRLYAVKVGDLEEIL